MYDSFSNPLFNTKTQGNLAPLSSFKMMGTLWFMPLTAPPPSGNQSRQWAKLPEQTLRSGVNFPIWGDSHIQTKTSGKLLEEDSRDVSY